MYHTVFHVIFAVSILWWLSLELKFVFRPFRHKKWLILNVIASILASYLALIDGGKLGNILLHAIGGGVASALTYEYLKAHIATKLNWRFDVVILFAFVSTFGVINELAEFLAESAGLGVFSVDSQDTWRDFVANTSGALIVWAVVRLYKTIKK